MPRSEQLLLPPCRALLLALLAVAMAGAPAEPAREAPGRQHTGPSVQVPGWTPAGPAPRTPRWQRARALDLPPTANQQAWDAGFYRLDLDLNPAALLLTGTVTMTAAVLAGPVSTAELDLADNMVVDAARAGGTPAGFTHAGGILAITLDRPYGVGESFAVEVDYHGTPWGGSFAFDSHGGQPMIWSLSEPFGARSWWPCKDHPADKADSVDIRVQVPAGLITASNGTRVEATDDGVVAVTRWQERYAIATYLVSVAIHPYVTGSGWFVHGPGDSMELQFYVFPDQVAAAAPINARLPEMLAVLSGYFGEYPFIREKYGHAQYIWAGGAEHQTCTSIGTWSEPVAVHELAHQWWGDMVTCREFNHFWLNEGPATYGEVLWAEAQEGPAAARENLSFNLYFGPGTVHIPDLEQVDPAHETDLYFNKASWVLHMLRHRLGDAGFFAALGSYGAVHRYGTATTADFQAACEAASGRDLGRFFERWVYGEFYPRYRYRWSQLPGGGGWDVTLTVEQMQPGPAFAMPLDVVVTTEGGPEAFVIEDSLASQAFLLHTVAPPLAVAVDPGHWILGTIEEPVTDPGFTRPVLLVNGVSWEMAGVELRSACLDRAFWGDYPIDFWDLFEEPAGGYPGTLPPPLGHGALPTDVIGNYRNVIWVADHNQGDIGYWLRSPVPSYLEAGGNVILLSRHGPHFVTEWHRDYLGLAWADGTRIHDCLSAWPGLPDLRRLASMNDCAVFETVLARSDSRLLYRVDYNYDPDRGIGVWRQPEGGGRHRPGGGQFIFLSGVPYRWNHADLRSAISYMLGTFFQEPPGITGAPEESAGPARVRLEGPRPNPFRQSTAVTLTLPRAVRVRASVFDVRGGIVRRLVEGPFPAGEHRLAWDGRTGSGVPVPAGVYWMRAEVGGEVLERKVVRVH